MKISYIEFIREVYGGKTIGRILFNDQVFLNCNKISGEIVDLASGEKPSYYNFLPKDIKIKRSDYIKKSGVENYIDLNEILPFPDNTFDVVLMFNAIYILNDPTKTLSEIKRVLKPGGKFFLSSPVSNIETPEPVDFRRYTLEGLESEFKKVGFNEVIIKRYGDRFSSVANLIHPFVFLKTLRLVIYSLALIFDKLIPKNIRENHPAPLGYFCEVKK